MEEEQELTKEELQELKNLAKVLKQMKNSDNQSSSSDTTNHPNNIKSNTSLNNIETTSMQNIPQEHPLITNKNIEIIENKEKIDNLEYKYHESKNNKLITEHEYKTEDKTVIGVLCAMFLPFIIGIIIGFCAFPYQSRARQTYFKAYWLTLCIVCVISLLIGIIISSYTGSNSMY